MHNQATCRECYIIDTFDCAILVYYKLERLQRYCNFFIMKVFEALNLLKSPIFALLDSGVHVEDVKYLQLYKYFKCIVSEGNKRGYAAAVVSEKYSVSIRTVYDIVKRFDKDCNELAT